MMKREQQDEVSAWLQPRSRRASRDVFVRQVFRQIMETHNGTVDSYLQDIITETVASEAREQVTCMLWLVIVAWVR